MPGRIRRAASLLIPQANGTPDPLSDPQARLVAARRPAMTIKNPQIH